MPLLDVDNPRSAGFAQAYALRARLSECSVVQDLFGEANATDSLPHIEVGPSEPSSYGEQHTIDDLKLRNAWMHVVPPDEAGFEWFEDEAGEDSLLRFSGQFAVWVRWQVADVLLNSDGVGGCFNYFWDLMLALPDDLRAAVRATGEFCPRMRGASLLGVRWCEREEDTEQGVYMQAEFAVPVGDLSE